MIPLRIPGFTRYLGKPLGWRPETHGECGSLAVRDIQTTSGPAMVSAWEPTPEQLARLAAGAPVLLGICGEVHPPVFMDVGQPPEEGPE